MAIDLHAFQLVLLRRPDDALACDDGTIERINTDPAVQAGRLEVLAMTWLGRPGTMVRDGKPLTVED